jgi:hypothetical protein
MNKEKKSKIIHIVYFSKEEVSTSLHFVLNTCKVRSLTISSTNLSLEID